MHEIKIYGEIVPFNDAYITEGETRNGYCTLSFVQDQLKEAKGKPLKVRINSFGGDVITGFAIYFELRRYADTHNVKIITVGEAYVASIATVIYLAGDERILSGLCSPFVHNAWSEFAGDSKKMAQMAKDLEDATDEIAKHYESHTDLTYEEARELMEKETSITADQAVKMRFAHKKETVSLPKAMKRFTENNTNKKSQNMKNDKKDAKSLLTKVLAYLNPTAIKNKKISTADEMVLDFYELDEEATPAVGDMANVDGTPAEGEYVMKDGETYVFTAGELMEIREPEEENTDDADMEALRAENAALTQALEGMLNAMKDKDAKLKAFEDAKSKTPVNNKRGNQPNPKDTEVKKGERAGSAIAKMRENANKPK